MNQKLAVLGGTPVAPASYPAWPVVGEPELDAVRRVVESGHWGHTGSGEQTTRIEKRFAEYVGVRHAVAVANGSIALRLALLAIGVQAGDEVIVPPYTFIATASAVVECNATPIFVDVCRESLNIDPAKIEAAITPRTRAIIPVHMGGMAVDIEPILAIARRHKLVVIEDCAHAHGSEWNGRRIGSFGDMACFSFQSSKNLTSGEGGMVVTNNSELSDAVWSVHNCGRRRGGAWYEHAVIAGNYRLAELQSALLNCQLDRLEAQIDQRERNASYLSARLAKLRGITPQKRDLRQGRNSFHVWPFRYDESVFSVERAVYLQAAKAEGLPVGAGYPVPVYKQPLFLNREFGPYTGCGSSRPGMDFASFEQSCPNCEELCRSEAGWMTQTPLLLDDAGIARVADAFEKLYVLREQLQQVAGAAVSAQPQAIKR